MNSDLLKTAELLAKARPRRPAQTDLRRAVSTAHYAVFHALARTCADQLVGTGSAGLPERTCVYRALEHGGAKSALLELRPSAAAAETKRFGQAFARLQKARHTADYDPSAPKMLRAQVVETIAEADTAIQLLQALPPKVKLGLAVHLLFRRRP